MNETQLEQISEAVTHVSQPEVKVEEDFSRMSDPPEKSHLNEEEPSPVPKAPSPVIINFTASKNTNGNNEEHNNTTPTTETQSPKPCSPSETKPASDIMIVVVDEDTNAPSKESNDEKPVVSEPVSTPGESGIPQVEAINGANGSASPDPANGDSEDNDKENVESGNEAILDPFNNVDEMLRRMDEIDPGHKLRSLCKKGDAGALTEFLKEDVDLNVVSEEGWTCLHEIITHECQFTEVARILMNHGAKVNTQDLHGDSPLHSCLLYHCTENIQLLLNNGADVELTNGIGRKPIHVANDEESLRLLLEHGADVNAIDQMGNTCLHYAVVAKDKDRVKLLLSPKYNSDVSIKNATGATPLHLATEPEITSMLLDASADPNVVDLAGNSPLHLAVRGRHKEVVRNLMEKKANPNIANGSGKLPASLAKDKEMKNILAGKVGTSNGTGSPSGSGNVTPTMIQQSRKRPYSPSTPVIDSTPTSSSLPQSKETPGSILKKKRRISNENGERTTRLRFSDVNEYNSIEEACEKLDRRVRARPIYSEPQFSSDED